MPSGFLSFIVSDFDIHNQCINSYITSSQYLHKTYSGIWDFSFYLVKNRKGLQRRSETSKISENHIDSPVLIHYFTTAAVVYELEYNRWNFWKETITAEIWLHKYLTVTTVFVSTAKLVILYREVQHWKLRPLGAFHLLASLGYTSTCCGATTECRPLFLYWK